MYIEVTEQMFIDVLMKHRPDNFSYEGLKALYEYYNDYEEATGTTVELDVIAICCEHSEMTEEEALDVYEGDIPHEHLVIPGTDRIIVDH
jgi:hypothetical protein